ncbi:MAG: hypothetical protein IPK26_09060 [Planctomycetes bacterium]|nr:hypothetical protein [Planctomycetota bacterium]
MNRILLVCNAILALILAIRVANPERVAHAATPVAGKPAWSAADLRLLPGAKAERADPRWRTLLLDFGTDVAAEPLPTGSQDLGLRFEPAVDFAATWRTRRTLQLFVPGGLSPARRFHLHLSQTVTAADGRRLPAGTTVAIDTPTVRLESAVLDRGDERIDPGAPAVTLLVAFDQRIGRAAVENALRVRDPRVPDRDLPFVIGERPDAERAVFALRVDTGGGCRELEVVAAPGLVPLAGELPTGAEQVRRVVLFEPLDLRGVSVGEGRIDVRFNQAVAMPIAEQIRLVPPVPFQVLPRHDGVRLVGRFAPGSVLAVELARGFPGTGRTLLAQAVRHSVLVPDLDAEVGLQQSGSVLSSKAESALTIAGVNVGQVRVAVRRVYANNLVRALQEQDHRTLAEAMACVVPIAARRNERWERRVDLRPLLGTMASGLFQVEVSSDETPWPESRLLQVTDLGLTLRAGRDQAVVQVVGIADGRPVANAAVRAITATNQVLASATTDWDGIARLSWSRGDADRSVWLVQAQAGDDEAFACLEDHAVELADESLGGRPWLGEGVEAWAWPTRGIVRPGERVEVIAALRDATGSAAAARQLICEFATAGRVQASWAVRASGSGLFTAMLPLRADAPTGAWQARFRLTTDGPVVGETMFEVAAFVPDRLEAAFGELPALRFGATAAIPVRANWLDGTPAAGRPVRLRTRLLAGAVLPAAAEGFAFASGDAVPPGELEAVNGLLDERGETVLQLPLPATAALQTLRAVLSLEVLDPSGRAVRVAATAPVLRPTFHLGVRAEPGRARLVAVDADGRAVTSPIEATMRLEQRSWQWHYQPAGDGRWRWRTSVRREVLAEWPLTLRGGEVEQVLPEMQAEGWYVVVATSGELAAEQVVGAAPERPDRLRVTPPVEPAMAGATASVAVESPAAGRALVTIETDTVHSATTVLLQQGHNVVPVTVPAGLLLPNVHVVVTLTRPATASGAGDGPPWLIGGAALPLRRDEARIAVDVRAPAVVLPEADLAVDVAAPGATTAVVAVVDEGVLAVTGHRDPDPLAFVLARRRLQVAGADLAAFLLQGMKFTAGAKTGGGDGDDDDAAMMLAGSINTRIRPLALCEVVLLDGAGRGRVALPLPRYEGRVRVMVVAAGPRGLGAASTPVVVKAPLGLQVALPRMVAPDDRFAVPVTLRNDTGQPGVVVVAVAAGAGLELAAAPRHAVPLAVGQVATVDVALLASPAGPAVRELRVEATLGDQRRMVTEAVDVRARLVPGEDWLAFELEQPHELTLADGWSGDGLQAELVVERTPVRQLRPLLEALLRFPYGCCEQTASQGMGLLACQALLPRLWDANDPRLPQASALVQAAVDRLFLLQTDGGGFGWWSPRGEEWDYGTVHALDFLLSAQDAGATLPPVALAAAIDRLQRLVERHPDLSMRCHAIEVLSRAGRAVQPRLDWLCTQVVHREDRARLALALVRLGEKRQAAALLQPEDAPPAGMSETTGMLRSPLREQALWFWARMALDPTDRELPLLALALQRAVRHVAALTTHESAQALRALAAYWRMQPMSVEAMTVAGSLDGVPLPAPVGDRIGLAIRPGSKLQIQGGGRGFALVSLRGLRPATPSAGTGTITLRREVIDLDTGAPAGEFVRGRVYEVRIHGAAERTVENVAFVDLLPGGLEAEAPGPSHGFADADDGPRVGPRAVSPILDRRDDRVVLFCLDRLTGEFVCSHRVRAVTPGSFTWPALTGQPMYDLSAVITGGDDRRIEVRP